MSPDVTRPDRARIPESNAGVRDLGMILPLATVVARATLTSRNSNSEAVKSRLRYASRSEQLNSLVFTDEMMHMKAEHMRFTMSWYRSIRISASRRSMNLQFVKTIAMLLMFCYLSW